MSDSDRGRISPVVTALFLAVLAALVLKVTWEIAASTAKDRYEAEQTAKEYADRTHERIANTCDDMVGAVLAKCADEIIKASHEAQTAQRDLAAQRGMETWAMAMFWATAVSVLVTGIGIYYVRKTLAANTDAVAQAKRANDIARENLYLDQRPWLTIRSPMVTLRTQDDGTRRLQAEVEVRNRGEGPALAVKVKARFFEPPYNGDHVLSFALETADSPLAHRVGTVVFAANDIHPRITGDIDDFVRPEGESSILVVCVTYEATGIERKLFAARAFLVEARDVFSVVDSQTAAMHGFRNISHSDLVG